MASSFEVDSRRFDSSRQCFDGTIATNFSNLPPPKKIFFSYNVIYMCVCVCLSACVSSAPLRALQEFHGWQHGLACTNSLELTSVASSWAGQGNWMIVYASATLCALQECHSSSEWQAKSAFECWGIYLSPHPFCKPKASQRRSQLSDRCVLGRLQLAINLVHDGKT